MNIFHKIKCFLGYHTTTQEQIDKITYGGGIEHTKTKYSCKYCNYEKIVPNYERKTLDRSSRGSYGL